MSSAFAPGPVEVVRLAYGLCQLAAPRLLARVVLHEDLDDTTAAVVRVLGARHTVQALLTATGSARAHRRGGVVDLLHAVSLVPIGAWSGRRRLALADGVVASGFAVAELSVARA